MSARDDVLEILWPDLIAEHGYGVMYERDGILLASDLQAIKGRKETEASVDEYTSTVMADDFIFRIEDLRTEGIGAPQRGDMIIWTDTFGDDHRHEVHLPGTERQYDAVDQHRALIRVHTKEVA